MDWKKCAEKAIEDILNRGKTPIVCGGTGFYIQAISDGIKIPEIKPDWKLRKKLEKETTEKLFEKLKQLAPERAKTIDAKNPRRLIRAIEIAMHPALHHTTCLAPYGAALRLGIKLSKKELDRKIEKRAKKMLAEGLVEETRKLRQAGLSWKRLNELGFEYKYPAMFLWGKIGKDEMKKQLILNTRRYAKRQMTWFKRDKRIHWVKNPQQALALVEKFISRSGVKHYSRF